ncbi:hypothetical protein NU219Hw_g2604t1 [Hortaea werneckii]
MLHHFNQIQFPSQPTPPSLSPPNPGPSLSIPSQPNPKLRAACDECRLKKLKCTGEQPTCSRCGREGIRCIYSPQKPMGRPKKRQRMEAAEEDGEAFYPQPQQQQEGHVALLQPVSKPDRIGAAKEDSDFPPFAMEFSQASGNTTAATAAAADVTTTTSDWTSWEDFERFLGNGEELHPFLSSNNWSAEVPGQDALPGLTPDFATAFPSEGITPPVLNLPLELLLPQQAWLGKETSNGGVEWGIGEGDTSREDQFLGDGEPVTAPGRRGGWEDDLNLASALLPSIPTTTAQPQTPPPPNPQNHHRQPPPPPLPVPTCACLSTLYLTLSTLQQRDPHPSSSSSSSSSFPNTLLPLRTAMQTATSILTCRVCPGKFLSAVQNTQLLGTLLVCIAERFRVVVEGIEAEEGREGKGGEWRGWAKGVVWGEVYGRGGGRRRVGGMKGVVGDDGETDEEEEEGEEGDPSLRSSASTSSSSSSSSSSTFSLPSITATTTTEPPPIHFLALTKAMYDRQLAWHSSTKEVVTADGKVQTIPSLPEDFPRDREGKPIGGPSVRREDHMCLKFRGFAEKLVEGLDWS